MKKYVCINILCSNLTEEYVDTWYYDIDKYLDLEELADDLTYLQCSDIYYNMYEVKE